VEQRQSKIQAAADRLWRSFTTGETCEPVRDLIGETDQETAYKVQEINVKRRMDRGEKPVGKKIGLTSCAVQKQLGVDQPDYGLLFHTTEVKNGGELSTMELLQPKAEAEIAFIVGKDLTGDVTMETLTDAIDYACASIEIVGSRVADWNIRITDTIADNASASHYVLGDNQVSIDNLDLVNCKMSMTKNDEVASEGSGKACMDNPLNATLWLVQTMIKNGQPIRKGEVLLSGALGPMVNISEGDHIKAEIEGLGSVEVRISE